MDRKKRAIGAFAMGGLASLIFGPIGLLVAPVAYYIMGGDDNQRCHEVRYQQQTYIRPEPASFPRFSEEYPELFQRTRDVRPRFVERPSRIRFNKFSGEWTEE